MTQIQLNITRFNNEPELLLTMISEHGTMLQMLLTPEEQLRLIKQMGNDENERIREEKKALERDRILLASMLLMSMIFNIAYVLLL